jgi:lipoate-protein ligase A
MLEALQLLDDPVPRPAPLNMAIDEALLEMATVPVLRFYRWERPAFSFGYFGRYAEVAAESDSRDIVRRWTGGGIVPHGADLTYSLIIPASDLLFAKSSPEIYREVHEAVRRALENHAIATVLADGAAPKISDHCFANAVRADVVSDGHKIAGAAHRRSRRGLLHQGSIQRPGLPPEFRRDLARLLCDKFECATFATDLFNRAKAISDAKYSTNEWLRRR